MSTTRRIEKALKMGPAKIFYTFNPYEMGIIDTTAQGLQPSALDSENRRAVRAELYKLNVSDRNFRLAGIAMLIICRLILVLVASSSLMYTPRCNQTSFVPDAGRNAEAGAVHAMQ